MYGFDCQQNDNQRQEQRQFHSVFGGILFLSSSRKRHSTVQAGPSLVQVVEVVEVVL